MSNNKQRPTAEAIEKLAIGAYKPDIITDGPHKGEDWNMRDRDIWKEGFKAALDQLDQQPFKPCGEGDNICNCKSAEECGYLHQPVSTGDRSKIEDLHMKHIEETGLGRPMLYSEMDVKQFTINFAKAYAAQEVEAAKAENKRLLAFIEELAKLDEPDESEYDLSKDDEPYSDDEPYHYASVNYGQAIVAGDVRRKCVVFLGKIKPAAPQQEGGNDAIGV